MLNSALSDSRGNSVVTTAFDLTISGTMQADRRLAMVPAVARRRGSWPVAQSYEKANESGSLSIRATWCCRLRHG